jgi:hypothetical protein
MKSSVFFSLLPALKLVSFMTDPSILKMEATSSFETSVEFLWAKWRYIPEEKTIQIKYIRWISGSYSGGCEI